MTALECEKTHKDLQSGLENLIDNTDAKTYPWAKKPEYEVKRRFWNSTPGQVNLDEM
jgi:hypothetical protein